LAYATRYGRISLREAATMDQAYLGYYLDALSELVAEESGESSLRET